jgi:hypothetical protein
MHVCVSVFMFVCVCVNVCVCVCVYCCVLEARGEILGCEAIRCHLCIDTIVRVSRDRKDSRHSKGTKRTEITGVSTATMVRKVSPVCRYQQIKI